MGSEKIILRVLAALSVFMLQISQAAAYDVCEMNEEGVMIYYDYVEDGLCEVAQSPDKYSGVINVPATIEDGRTTVAGVGFLAFYDCPSLTEVNLPNTTLYVESWSFAHCYELTSVYMGENVWGIGDNAFESCSNLTSINIPNSLEYAGYEAFYLCYRLHPLYNDHLFVYYPTFGYPLWTENYSYVIPDGITTIGISAFGYSYLKEVTIPSTVNTIMSYAFDGTDISTIELPTSVTTLGKKALGQTWLTSVTIPSTVKEFGAEMFEGCGRLESVDLQNHLDSIPFGTFGGCSSLKQVQWHSDIRSIGGSAFFNCMALEQLDLPATLDRIGDYAFYRCEGFKEFTVPEGITKIEPYTFIDCRNLEQIHLPGTLTQIDDFAFSYCEKLQSLTLPDAVRSIGYNAFGGCKSLQSASLSQQLQSIGESAFQNCQSITSIQFPMSLQSIGGDAFAYCTALKDVYAPWEYPIEIPYDVFWNPTTPEKNTVLHVPAGSIERYAESEGWSYLENIVEDTTDLNRIMTHDWKQFTPKRFVDGRFVMEHNGQEYDLNGRIR